MQQIGGRDLDFKHFFVRCNIFVMLPPVIPAKAGISMVYDRRSKEKRGVRPALE
jgi:hypothetical protein